MKTDQITPTCRYGHGKLKMEARGAEPADSWYALLSTLKNGQLNTAVSFVTRIYSCPVCTYVELHDVPLKEFEDSLYAHNPQFRQWKDEQDGTK